MSRVGGELLARAVASPPDISPGSGSDLLDRLPTGQLVRAEVVRLLSDNLLSLAFPGGTLQARSDVPVAEGDQLLLQVRREGSNPATLRLVQREGVNDPKSLDAGTSSVALAATRIPSQARESLPTEVARAIKAGGSVEQLLQARPDLGPRVKELLAQGIARPTSLGNELTLLRQEVVQITGRDGASPAERLPSTNVPQPASRPLSAGATAIDLVTRALDRLVSSNDLSTSARWAEALLNRILPTSAGLEPALARLISAAPGETKIANLPTPSAIPLPSTASPALNAGRANQAIEALASLTGTGNRADAPANTSSSISASLPPSTGTPTTTGLQEEWKVVLAPDEVDTAGTTNQSIDFRREGTKEGLLGSDSHRLPAHSPVSGTESTKGNAGEPPPTIRGVLESDLKGQLLELRGKLETLGGDQPSPTVSSALARTDRLIDQMTSQQLRNVDGMQQYFQVSIPTDPKSGVEQAHLQAFYRPGLGEGEGSLDESGRFTVALFLQLSQLGDVLATVTGVEGTVSIAITAENDAIADRLAGGVQSLRAGLEAVGQMGAMITVRARPVAEPQSDDDLWSDFVEPTLLGLKAGHRLDREA